MISTPIDLCRNYNCTRSREAFKIKKKLAVFTLATGISIPGFATTFFFPGIQPVYTSAATPKWLQTGHGQDGYVTITSEVIPASSCVPLSNHSFWGGEKTQLVLSMTTNGFATKLDGSEIPIATFDGRDNGSECASLSTLPINIVPPTLLASFSAFNPGKLSLVLNVKSSSNSNQDFIGSAKLLLGAAAMVVSGGTASTIGGIAATVGNPVLSEAQTRTNTLMQDMVNGKSTINLTWPKLRNAIRSIEIPVYRAESSLGSSPDQRILQLQADKMTGKTVLFTVKLSFSYTSSLFDTASADGLPDPDRISSVNVLNHPVMNSQLNFLQTLNERAPSLLKRMENATGRDLTNACSIVLDKLNRLGLSNMDMAIVMKSFMDEARGGANWYSDATMVNHCFAQVPGVQVFLERLYGVSSPKFVIGDVQDGIGKPYRVWRDLIGPALLNLRKGLIAKENRNQCLADLNGKHDIKVSFSPEIQPWSAPSDKSPSENQLYPGIETLTHKEIKTIGCFVYKDADNLNPDNPGAYFVLEDVNDNFWLSTVKLLPDRTISTLNLSELTADWENYLASYSYPGGDCAGILSRFKQQINLKTVLTEDLTPAKP